MNHKYIAEFGINMLSGACVQAQQPDLPQLPEFFNGRVPPFHIYMICTRPRFTFDPSVFHIDSETISGRFMIQRGTKQEAHDYMTRNLLGRSDISFDCPYPHNFAKLVTSDGHVISGGKTAILVAHFGSQFWPLLDLDIQYIGQAFGDQGERLAPERLGAHATLQAIYADVIEKQPDKDVWITLWQFKPLLLTMIGGIGPITPQVSDAEDTAHIEQVTQAELPEDQLVNLTEAALIKYFQPLYNTHFKDKFPHPDHDSYKTCYDLDLNTISVEIQSHKLPSRLMSKTVPPNWLHLATFPLHSREKREAMFDFLK